MKRHAEEKHPEKWNEFKNKANDQPTIIESMFKPKNEVYKIDSLRRKKLNTALVKFLSTDIRPISIVKGEGFKEFIREIDPKYVLPSINTIRDKLVPTLHQSIMSELKQELENVKHICLTTDGWTSGAGSS